MPPEPGTPAFYNEKLESIIAEDRALRRQRRDTPRELDFGAYDDPPRRAMAGEEGASVAAAAAALIPFQMVMVSETAPYKFRIVPGFVRSQVYDVNFGSFLGYVYPEYISNGAWEKTVEADEIAYLEIKLKQSNLSVVSLKYVFSSAVQANHPEGSFETGFFYGYLPIGMYSIVNGNLVLDGPGIGNQSHLCCDGAHYFWVA